MKPLVTALLVLLAGISLAQQSDLDKPIQLKKGWMRIDVIMQEIYKQGGLKFSFNSQQIDPARKVQITSDRLSVGAILTRVEETAGVKFKVVGRHIVLLNQTKQQKPNAGNNSNPTASRVIIKKESSIKQHRSSSAGKLSPSSKASNKPAALNRWKEPVVAGAAATFVSDSTWAASRIDKLDSYTQLQIKPTPLSLVADTLPSVSRPPAPAIMANAVSENERPFWISAGANASEISYFNPAIRAGYKRVYGIAAIETCSCNPHVQWGIGWEFWQGRSGNLHQLLTTGTTASLYPAGTLPEVLVKNRHFKWSILFSKTIANRIDIQAGPAIHMMHTRYFSKDAENHQQKIAAGALLPETMDGDKIFTATEAPYTLINTYKKERTANWKGWIGASAGVYYRLPFSLQKPARVKTPKQ